MNLTTIVVDVDPLALRLARAILEREGHRAITLSRWSEVAPTLFGEKVDLVLVDVNMPGLTGDKLVEVVKQTGTGRRTPLVLVSNLPENELRQRAQVSGADGWIQKPMSTDKLRQLVDRFFSE